jgi:hypothetical protein
MSNAVAAMIGVLRMELGFPVKTAHIVKRATRRNRGIPVRMNFAA